MIDKLKPQFYRKLLLFLTLIGQGLSADHFKNLASSPVGPYPPPLNPGPNPNHDPNSNPNPSPNSKPHNHDSITQPNSKPSPSPSPLSYQVRWKLRTRKNSSRKKRRCDHRQCRRRWRDSSWLLNPLKRGQLVVMYKRRKTGEV